MGGQLTGTLALFDLVLADRAVAEFFGTGAGRSIKRLKYKNGQSPGKSIL